MERERVLIVQVVLSVLLLGLWGWLMMVTVSAAAMTASQRGRLTQS